MKTESKPVEIQLPIVKLRVEDLSWLLGMAKETAEIKCTVPYKNMYRLLILGLVEKFELPPCPTKTREFQGRRSTVEGRLRKCITPKSIDWESLGDISMSCLGDRYRPGKREGTRITVAGRALIKDGTAKVQISKSCK